jgi:hypothetical protein
MFRWAGSVAMSIPDRGMVLDTYIPIKLVVFDFLEASNACRLCAVLESDRVGEEV